MRNEASRNMQTWKVPLRVLFPNRPRCLWKTNSEEKREKEHIVPIVVRFYADNDVEIIGEFSEKDMEEEIPHRRNIDHHRGD